MNQAVIDNVKEQLGYIREHLAHVSEVEDVESIVFDVSVLDGLISILSEKENKSSDTKEIIYAEWKMVLDDFDDGLGERELPHCTNCNRGVYIHDAGSWCPFCGASMKNSMR